MGSSSKELLHLEHKNLSAASALESSLLVCNKDSVSHSKKSSPHEKPPTTTVAQSLVLGKVKDFLGVISEANKQLQQDGKKNSQKYDIEALTGTESEVIEMDLMLGIADLHTPEAIAAAESAISNGQLVPLDSDSTETESEGTSDDDENDETDSEPDNDENDDKTLKQKVSKFSNDGSSQAAGEKGSKKRPRIIEMS